VAEARPIQCGYAHRAASQTGDGRGVSGRGSRAVKALGRRYGSAFTVRMPIVGRAVIISDPAQIKELFTAGSDLVKRPGNLGKIFGPGSTFSSMAPSTVSAASC